MGIGQWLVYSLRLRWHDLTEYGSDLLKFRRHPKHALAGETTGKLDGGVLGKKVAIVAIYPTSDIMFSIRNICSALSKNGYSILLVSSAKVAPNLKEELLGYCTLLFERFGFGRDFGSYAAAINWLDKRGDLAKLSSLVLANDSMFWPSNFSAEIHSLDSADGDWKCLYEHQKVRDVSGHAQSFFLMFGPKAVNHPKFREYWATYTPWSSRAWVIENGEVGLSTCMLKAGFRPHAAYTFSRIWSALRSRIGSDAVDLPLKMALLDVLDVDFKQLSVSSVSLSEKDTSSNVGIRDQLYWNTVHHLSHRLFEQSPSHGTGLLCNVLLGSPIKRDYCAKYGKPIGLVLAAAQGYDGDDLEHLHTALLAKGTRVQYDSFEQFLLDRGRL